MVDHRQQWRSKLVASGALGKIHLADAIDKNSQELSQHINELKGSGIYFRLLEKYLGTEALEMVRGAKE